MDLIADIVIIVILFSIVYVLKGKEINYTRNIVYGIYFLIAGKLFELILIIFSSQVLAIIASNKIFSSIVWVQVLHFPSIFLEVLGFAMILIFFIKSRK